MKKNRGFSILVTIVVLVIFAALGVVGLSLLTTESQISVYATFSSLAFYIAEGGFQYYLEELYIDDTWSSPPDEPSDITLGKGTFTITTVADPDNPDEEIDVISEAHVTGPEGGTIVRRVMAHVSQSGLTACNYVIYVSGNYTPGATVTGDIEEGATDYPTVDFEYYYNLAPEDQRIPAGGGSYNFPTGTSSGIWYIDDDVRIDSNTTLNGTIIATGSISSNNKSNITINATPYYPALLSNDAISISRQTNLNITGMVYGGADGSGNVTLTNSSGTVFGKVMAQGNLNTSGSGALNLTYNADLEDNPPPGFSGGGMSGIYNWRESYLGA